MNTFDFAFRNFPIPLATSLLFTLAANLGAGPSSSWVVNSPKQWKRAVSDGDPFSFDAGSARPKTDQAQFSSVLKSFAGKRQPEHVTFEQTGHWNNWQKSGNVEPNAGTDAPVFLPVGKNNYWYLNAKGSGGEYHAWHSKDMQNWTHHGNVVKNDWVTTAEYADGTFYIYYDEPNDEDPHLVLDDDLTDGKHRDKGKVFDDPSNGSDSGIIRDEDGSFHLIYEDWSPIKARTHSWDSPLAGHASSPDGINDFEPHEHPAPIDERTVPLPEFGTYNHPNGEYTYHKHAGGQDAFGDYTLIKVGSRYYIFCDYDPHGKPMRVGYWYSDSLYEPFQFGGSIGKGFHPDPSIGFAEGKFYLLAQGHDDYTSSGPWTEQVSVRVGADTNDDGSVDQWTNWQDVRETYTGKPGFARIVQRSPARIDLSSLPAGYGFRFEFKTAARSEKTRPIMDSVRMSFK